LIEPVLRIAIFFMPFTSFPPAESPKQPASVEDTATVGLVRHGCTAPIFRLSGVRDLGIGPHTGIDSGDAGSNHARQRSLDHRQWVQRGHRHGGIFDVAAPGGRPEPAGSADPQRRAVPAAPGGGLARRRGLHQRRCEPQSHRTRQAVVGDRRVARHGQHAGLGGSGTGGHTRADRAAGQRSAGALLPGHERDDVGQELHPTPRHRAPQRGPHRGRAAGTGGFRTVAARQCSRPGAPASR